MDRQEIFEEIDAERKYQDSRWGDEFDDKNTLNDWVTYITTYASGAAKMDNFPGEQRRQLLKTATLCVAAIEAYDRNGRFAPRHYESFVAE